MLQLLSQETLAMSKAMETIKKHTKKPLVAVVVFVVVVALIV